MKVALGHGSNSHGGSAVDVNGRGIIPSRPFREGMAHQVSLAEQHGIPTDHLMPAKPLAGTFSNHPGVKGPGRVSSVADDAEDVVGYGLPNWPNFYLHG